MKIVSIVGARPQFIKAATVSRALKEQDATELLVHTGQHYDSNMSDVFFKELDIAEPDHNLDIGSLPHGAQTGRMLEHIESILVSEKPSWVLVYGDTNSTLAGALAAAKLHIPVAHVEAGLRSFNRAMPEEVNRVLTDHVSQLLFTPTESGLANLLREGIARQTIHQVGDVMYDAALFYGEKAETESQVLHTLKLEPKGYILATVHRAENTDDSARLAAIFESFAELSKAHTVVLPLHPRTATALKKANLTALLESLQVTAPLGYLDMLMLERNASLILTDSGGVQKEAYFQAVPCVTLREETEWVELIAAGWNTLAPPTSQAAISQIIADVMATKPDSQQALYGDGHSSARIAELLLEANAHDS